MREKPSPATASRNGQSATLKPEQPAAILGRCVQQLVMSAEMPLTESSVAKSLDVTKPQARKWLQQLCDQGLLVRKSKPARYEPVADS